MHLMPCESDHLRGITDLLLNRCDFAAEGLRVSVAALWQVIPLPLERVTEPVHLRPEVGTPFEYQDVDRLREGSPVEILQRRLNIFEVGQHLAYQSDLLRLTSCGAEDEPLETHNHIFVYCARDVADLDLTEVGIVVASFEVEALLLLALLQVDDTAHRPSSRHLRAHAASLGFIKSVGVPSLLNDPVNDSVRGL